MTSAPDLAGVTASLVGVPSVTGAETELAHHVIEELSRFRRVERHGNCVVAPAPDDGRPVVTLVGHLDTVPPQGNEMPRVDGGRVWGIGATDMKGGLAVMLELAANLPAESRRGLALVFYPGEEGPIARNGLGPLIEWGRFPRTDLAVVLEPTDLAVQVGCVGTINAEVTFRGEAAHSARPWLGRNAIHMAGPFLNALAERSPRKVLVGQRLVYREVISATTATGGVARNVIPAAFTMNVNFRFAPNRTLDSAVAELEKLVATFGADVEVVDAAPAGPVCEDNPLLDRLRDAGLRVEAKQGWTDVAQIGAAGIDAINFGPGETALAHRPDESISVAALFHCYEVLWKLLTE